MSYYCIFPDSTEFPVPIYPVLGILVCSALYAALFQFTLQKIIEKLFALSAVFGNVQRTIIYLLIINFPAITLALSCMIYNHSLIGFFINIDIDIFQTLLLSAYICYIQESRQTPICGFVFIRDILITIGSMGCILKIYWDGKPDIAYGFILLSLYFIYYISQLFEQKLQDSLLRILKLKDNNDYNSAYLLTHAEKEANFLGLKEAIDSNQQRIGKQISQFKQILNNVIENHDERLILQNFSKLFVPYLTANKILQQEIIQKYQQIFMEQAQQIPENNRIEIQSVPESNHPKDTLINDFEKSDIEILNRNTLTDDFIIEEDQFYKEESQFQTVLKYSFYPIYLISFIEGRLRYLFDYICFFLLLGCMWMIGNSCYYFAKQTENKSYLFISIVASILLTIPPSRYYFKISRYNDFDFINIFLQGAILKTVIFGITITVIAFVDSSFSCYGGLSLMISVALSIATYFIYGVLMTAQKFATLKSNFRVVNGILIFMYLLRLTAQLVLNLVPINQ